MPSPRLFLHFSSLAFLVLVSPSIISAQRAMLGPSLTAMVSGGEGVAGSCLQDRYFAAIGLHLSKPIVGRLVILQAVGRGFWLGLGSSCVDAPLPPPQDGTFIVEQRTNLQARPFETTDARVGISLPNDVVLLSAGGGTAWREGHNAPYFVAALSVPSVAGTSQRFGFQIEYHWLRLASDRARRTYQNGQLVVDESLGTAYHWSHAMTLGMRLGIPL
jgi:hypothetical protein